MCCRLYGSFTEAEAQQRAKVAKHGLAADDKDPRINDGVERIESESCQVLFVTAKWMDRIDKACNL